MGKVDEMQDLPLLVVLTPIGKEVEINIVRAKTVMTKVVTIVELPEENMQSDVDEKVENELGMELSELTEKLAQQYGTPDKTEGMLVTAVLSGSAADRAGVRKGDMIVEGNREPIKNLVEYSKALQKTDKDGNILLLVKRGRGNLFVVITSLN
jgi:serine protease Do